MLILHYFETSVSYIINQYEGLGRVILCSKSADLMLVGIKQTVTNELDAKESMTHSQLI